MANDHFVLWSWKPHVIVELPAYSFTHGWKYNKAGLDSVLAPSPWSSVGPPSSLLSQFLCLVSHSLTISHFWNPACQAGLDRLPFPPRGHLPDPGIGPWVLCLLFWQLDSLPQCHLVHDVKCLSGWITSWNQDVQEKHQQLNMCRQYQSNGRKWRETKEPLDEDERGEWKAGSKLNIQKTKIMASDPITSWQIEGEKVETVTDFILLGSKITADGACSHESKRHFLLGRKAMINLDSILKSRAITLLTKVVCVVKVFPVVINGCESWTTKKAEHWRINTFKLWC